MHTALTTKLQPGTPAPGFTLPDAEGRPVTLADYRGRNVIVYFYPRAATPGAAAGRDGQGGAGVAGGAGGDAPGGAGGDGGGIAGCAATGSMGAGGTGGAGGTAMADAGTFDMSQTMSGVAQNAAGIMVVSQNNGFSSLIQQSVNVQANLTVGT